jgi:hypothetical protein
MVVIFEEEEEEEEEVQILEEDIESRDISPQ